MSIRGRRVCYRTDWFEVVAKQTDLDPRPYYALRLPDYVSVCALTEDDRLLLVRQYRPAVERPVLELPGGHVDGGETPAAAAVRELREETGHECERLEHLGTLLPDSGRLWNRMWCYLGRGARPVPDPFTPEPGIELVPWPRGEVLRRIGRGEMDHALNLAVLLLAEARHGPGLFVGS